jgi:hypothetical protein
MGAVMIKDGDFETPAKATGEHDNPADVSRRQSLGRLVTYTAPALLAMLISTDKAAAGTVASGAVAM